MDDQNVGARFPRPILIAETQKSFMEIRAMLYELSK
jgi:hypothetical protein